MTYILDRLDRSQCLIVDFSLDRLYSVTSYKAQFTMVIEVYFSSKTLNSYHDEQMFNVPINDNE